MLILTVPSSPFVVVFCPNNAHRRLAVLSVCRSKSLIPGLQDCPHCNKTRQARILKWFFKGSFIIMISKFRECPFDSVCLQVAIPHWDRNEAMPITACHHKGVAARICQVGLCRVHEHQGPKGLVSADSGVFLVGLRPLVQCASNDNGYRRFAHGVVWVVR